MAANSFLPCNNDDDRQFTYSVEKIPNWLKFYPDKLAFEGSPSVNDLGLY